MPQALSHDQYVAESAWHSGEAVLAFNHWHTNTGVVALYAPNIVKFEHDVYEWGKARLLETLWAISHQAEEKRRFDNGNNRLPPHLEELKMYEPRSQPQEENLPCWIPPIMAPANITDPSVLRAVRGWMVKGWKIVQMPSTHTKFDRREITVPGIWCKANVDYWIPLPPFTKPIKFKDGMHGRHEELREPHPHSFGALHMAMQPGAPRGQWHLKMHRTLSTSLLWYEPNFAQHFLVVRPQLATAFDITHYRLEPVLFDILHPDMVNILALVDQWKALNPALLATLPQNAYRHICGSAMTSATSSVFSIFPTRRRATQWVSNF